MDCGKLEEVTIELPDAGFEDSFPHGDPAGGGGGGGNTTPVGDDKDHNAKENPCDNIASLFDDNSFKNKFKELMGKTRKAHEYGYAEDIHGNFTRLKPKGNHHLELPSDATTVGFLHTHPTTPMFSPADFLSFRNLLNSAAQSDRPVENVYGIMMHKDKNYILKFDGNPEDIKIDNSLSGKKLKEKYKSYFEKKYPFNEEKAFINFLNDIMFTNTTKFNDGFHLFSFEEDKNGKIKKVIDKSLNDKGKVESNKC